MGACARLCLAVGQRPAGLDAPDQEIRGRQHRHHRRRSSMEVGIMMSVFGPRFGQICRQGNNGGQSPGEQNSYQTQNTTSTSAPSPEIQPWLKNLTDKLGGYLNQHQSAPSLYDQSFTAPMSDATRSGIAALTNFGNSGSSPLYASGTQLATDTMNGKFLNIDSNPYFQKSIAAGLVPLTQNL